MWNLFSERHAGCRWLCGLLAASFLFHFVARADQAIYADLLSSGWTDWSWATVNFANTGTVHGGADSISVTAGAWQALFLHSNATFDPSGYTNLSFWINGGSSGGELLQVQAILGGTVVGGSVPIAALGKTNWVQINAPLSNLIPSGQTEIDGFWIQDRSGTSQGTFYVDDIVLQAGTASVSGTNAAVAVTVDALANRHSISPLIYGVAFASSNELAGLNFTLNRSGGNAETRYNWQLNAHNHGADWYFESIADDGSTDAGSTADAFVADSKNGGAQAMITLPMIGWMPKLDSGRGKLASYSIAKYGPQTDSDSSWMPDAGNGISVTNDTAITWNDRTDANFQTNSAFQLGYVRHLINRWGASTNGGVRYYFMDNEHSIWYSTHQDVHPVGPTMQEIRDKILDYAGMVKTNDPGALVLGPEEWGWTGYFYSGYDMQNSGNTDRTANGGWDYMPWLLNQLHQHDTNAGTRLLDYFTLHCYPQGGEFGTSVTTTMQLLRNESTRQFWDTNYMDQSWIGQQATNNILMLIPRMKNWVAAYYPGTKTGITEYNWGAESHINGATAQADILGIFGREGLDLATRWTTPATNTPVYNAMKLYRNYDGAKSAFGDVSVSAAAPAPDSLSAFAAIRTNDSALTVMVVNKTLTNFTPLTLTVTHFAGSGTAQAWQLTSSNVITRLADVTYTGGVVSDQLPAQSITLFVLPAAQTFQLRLGTNAAARQLELWLDGPAGQDCILQSSTNLTVWSGVSTNTFVSNSFRVVVGTTNPARMFYRGVLSSR